ncbi:MAG: methyltransferase domain-containing protein [Acidimicrobiia bacterium]|nr:methyltransferase domain-containing protein [Acidimicrobiia bacterium]
MTSPDDFFADPRLVTTYDLFEGPRHDLDAYEAMVAEFGATSVLDVGCGTGEFACRLAQRGIDVVAVDPAAASIDVARGKPGSDLVTWFVGVVADVPSCEVDMVTMTANVAQVFLSDDDWLATLRAIRRSLRPDGHLVFETRDPVRRAWETWTPEATRATAVLPAGERVETWCELLSVAGSLVSFRWTTVFSSDGAVLTSDSTLRFRDEAEITSSLTAAGLVVDEVRDAPDRPGMELVFVTTPRQ